LRRYDSRVFRFLSAIANRVSANAHRCVMRLFVAVHLSAEVRERLATVQDRLRRGGRGRQDAGRRRLDGRVGQMGADGRGGGCENGEEA